MLFAFSLNIKAKTVCEYGDDLTLTFANGDLDIHVEDKFYTNYFIYFLMCLYFLQK